MSYKDILVSHVDLDGYGCEIVGRRFLDFREVHHIDYDQIGSTIANLDRDAHLYITDLSIPDYLAGLLDEFEDVTIIDHHVSTYWVIDRYRHSGKVDFSVSKDRCATYLFGEYLARTYGRPIDPWLKGWMETVDDYDRYVLSMPESERLNALLYITNRDRFVDDAMRMTVGEMLTANQGRIDGWMRSRQDYMDSTVKTRVRDDPVTYLVYAERHRSKIASELMADEGAELVFALSLRDLRGSIRSSRKSRIDCNRLAGILDPEGGGHLNASGFRIPQECLTDGFRVMEGMIPWDDIPRYDPQEEERYEQAQRAPGALVRELRGLVPDGRRRHRSGTVPEVRGGPVDGEMQPLRAHMENQEGDVPEELRRVQVPVLLPCTHTGPRAGGEEEGLRRIGEPT